MMGILDSLDRATARLIQIALKELGFYRGTTEGLPGPKTKAAYDAYLDAMEAGPSTLPQSVADIAQAEVGVREEPRDSNRGARVEEYQRATWLDGSGWPWCAAFVCWVIQQVETAQALPFQRPRTAGAWDFINWAQGQGLLRFDPRGNSSEIRRGDIVVFTFSHIGICNETTTGDTVHTVEGNTNASGSREGGGVYKQSRKRSQIRCVIRLEEEAPAA